MLSVQL